MNTTTYTYLLANPQEINDQHLAALDTVLAKYPYFQSARALRLKGLKNNDSFLYNDALKVTAAHTADRDILFQYITSDAFVQDKISEAILQHDASLNGLEVVAEDLSAITALELDKQIKTEIKKAEAILSPQLFERKTVASHPISEETLETTSEEKETPLLVDAPLAFQKSDTHSFSEWLQLTKAQPIDRSETKKEAQPSEENKETPIEKKFELIEKFIQEKPKLEVSALPSKQINLAKPYT